MRAWIVMAVALGLLPTASAQPEAPPIVLVVRATPSDRYVGTHCGRIAVAGYRNFRVDEVLSTSLAGEVPPVVRVVVGCPEFFLRTQHYRLDLSAVGPRTGNYGMFNLLRPVPDDGFPTFWARYRHRR
jgi:hypothetical protein